MAKIKTIRANWPKYLLQWGVLLAIAGFITLAGRLQAFDGNKESLASDVYWVDGYTKCICVNISYVLWILKEYAGMDYLFPELDIRKW